MPRRILEGKVVSNKRNKTVTVLVERKVQDALYGKIIRRSAKYSAHDETNQWNVGDIVAIEECRPISKTKTWTVVRGKAMGESQMRSVDDTDQKRASIKRNLSQPADKAPAKPAAEAKPAKTAKKSKKEE
jgi:small subunit ribosomal protein S17